MIKKAVCKWFRELGDVYTMTEWARETREIYTQLHEENKKFREIFSMLFLDNYRE